MRSTCLVLLLFFVSAAQGATWRVPADASSVSSALARAAPGESVVVSSGTWSPSVSGESFPLVVADGVTLLGAGMALTTLDAEGTAGVLRIPGPGTAVVRGFTLTGGNANRGGGVQIESGTPEIAECLIWRNGALKRGSGINVQGTSAPWIHHNVIWENFDTDLVESGDPHGIQCGETSTGLVEHNLIGRTDSNGLFAQETAGPIVRHNIFYANGIEGWRGRGICYFGSPSTSITYNLFFGNAISALVLRDAQGVIQNVSATEADAFFADDGIHDNLDGDPLLSDEAALVFTLSPGSPAIDAGDPALGSDSDGSRLDLGPFATVQVVSAPSPRGAVSAVQNRPNPFNPRTRIEFELAAPQRVEVVVVDARGRHVRRLEAGFRDAGPHSVQWDGQDDLGGSVASGLYLAIVRTEQGRATTGMVLVR
jgi:hypothetical protein